MDSQEVADIVRAEIRERGIASNPHDVDLDRCLVAPRRVRCKNTFPLQRPKPRHLDLWLVLEETPGSPVGYLIVFDDSARRFGLASASDEGPVLFGWYGGFIDALASM